MTFDKLVTVLGNALNPTLPVIAERFKFHNRNQHEGEIVGHYVAALCKLTKH